MRTRKFSRPYRRLVGGLLLLCCLSSLVGTLAYFTDQISASGSVTAGSMNLMFTDISASKTGANGILSPNEFALDGAWTNNSLVSSDGIINPGDYFDLSYKLSNTGNKSMDIRQVLVISSTTPLSDAPEYKLTIIGEDYDTTAVAGSLAEDRLSIRYQLEDVLLNGIGSNAEVEDGISWTEQTYIVRLDFAADSGNIFQGSGVSATLDAKAKQHRNTADADWEDWENFETGFERVDGDTSTDLVEPEPEPSTEPSPEPEPEPEAGSEQDAQNRYYEEYGEEAPEFYMMSASTTGDVTYGFFLDNFEVTYFNKYTTEFAAIGWRRLSYHAAEDEWVFTDFSTVESGGWNYTKNIQSCTVEKIYYRGREIWPNVTI